MLKSVYFGFWLFVIGIVHIYGLVDEFLWYIVKIDLLIQTLFMGYLLYLLPLFPLTFINCTIAPIHFSISISDIINKVTNIFAAIWPNKYAITLLFLIYEISFICISTWMIWFSPCSFPRTKSLLKFALIWTSIVPKIFSLTMRFSIFVITFV